LRTALYNYFYAKKNDGKFILRIEDTDKTREVPGSIENIILNLKWAGIKWDEGPGAAEDTQFGPYIQSKRLEIYNKYAKQLVEDGHAYYCFCSEERLATVRAHQQTRKQIPKYDRHCKSLKDTEIYEKLRNGEKAVIRLEIPKGETTIADLVKGEVTFNNEQLDDQVLIKSDGYPTYHMANVIDDALMEISHVIRGENRNG
jgi:glutamyl-tRNA synthetase